jgi:DNA-binding IclR family transcriptional regulator
VNRRAAGSRDEPGAPLQTLARGLDLLFLFSETRPALSIAEIAAALAVPRSTAYRLVRTLRSRGLLREHSTPGAYGLGWSLLSLAHAAEGGLDLPRLLYPVMVRLHAQTGETVILTAAAGLMGVCLERIESPHSVRLSMTKGQRMALHAGASAKVLLAFQPETVWDRVVEEIGLQRFTPRTLVRPAALRADLRRIRRLGYAVSRAELDDGAWAVAAPVLTGGRLVAGLTVAGPLTRFPRAALPRLVRAVREAAAAASETVRSRVAPPGRARRAAR